MNSFFLASPVHLVGGKEYAWDGKGPEFECDQDLFFFSSGKFSISKKLSAYDLFAYILLAWLPHLRFFLPYAVFILVACYVFVYS